MNNRSFLTAVFVCILACFSLAVQEAHAAILQPSGGEAGQFWAQGTTRSISWDTADFHGTVSISLWNSQTGVLTVIATNATASTGQYAWSIPSTHATGTGFRMKVQENSSTASYQMSAAYFPIYEEPDPIASGVGSEDEQSASGISVYPNPAREHATARWPGNNAQRLIVRSVTGRKIANTSAFHTHAHFSSAAAGKSAVMVV